MNTTALRYVVEVNRVRSITKAAQKGAAKAMGKVPANALRKVGTARMRRRRVRASFLPRIGQGIGCV